MGQQTPSVLEIDRKLRDDFRRRVKDFGVNAEATDPLLAVLFRTVAQQIDQVYGDTAQLRLSLLRELMNGLDVQAYLARPAQAVVRLVSTSAEPRTLRAGTEMNATTPSGERLIFGLDATLEISQARLSMALSYQNQALRILPGVEMSESAHALRPSLDAVPVALGEQPALFLAFENLPPRLISRHGIFFELGPGTFPVQHALMHEPWWIFNEAGELSGDGLLRPVRCNGGLHELRFQVGDRADEEGSSVLPEIADGFYGGRQFVFPAMSGERRLLDGHRGFLAQRCRPWWSGGSSNGWMSRGCGSRSDAAVHPAASPRREQYPAAHDDCFEHLYAEPDGSFCKGRIVDPGEQGG